MEFSQKRGQGLRQTGAGAKDRAFQDVRFLPLAFDGHEEMSGHRFFRFIEDGRANLKDEEKAKVIVRDVLDCSNADFYELHKFEKHVDGCMVFRAKTEGMHIVYCVDKDMRIIFMRVFKNFKEYEKFLDDKRELAKFIMRA